MITLVKKPLVLAAALISPVVLAMPASANTTSSVSIEAVQHLTTSLKDTASAYEALHQGNVSAAKTRLDQALSNMKTALSKDSTLGVSQISASTFHQELKMVRETMRNSDSFSTKSELEQVLTKAGISTNI